MADEHEGIPDLATHRQRRDKAKQQQGKLADIYRRATVSLTLQITPEERALVEEIAALRECDESRAVAYSLADEHFLLKRRDEGWNIWLERGEERRAFPEIDSADA